MLALIHPAHIPGVWPLAQPWIEKACQRIGKFSQQDIYGWLTSGSHQLWMWMDGEVKAVAVTQIAVYSTRKNLYVNIATGKDRHLWQHCLADLENWARSQGCKGMELVARPGWKKVFKHYRMTHVVMEREL